MNSYLIYFLQSAILLTGMVLIYQFILRPSRDFRIARPLLISGVLIAIFSPLLSFDLFNSFGNSPAPLISHLSEVFIISEETMKAESWSSLDLLFLFYSIGVGLMVLRLFFSIRKLILLTSTAERKNAYWEIANSQLAFSFLGRIYIGADIAEEDRTTLVDHEQIHIARFHSIDLILCQMIELIFWFNPLVYKLKYFLDEVHEYEADELSCANTDEYLQLLLKQNFEVNSLQLIHQFNANHLKSRIMRIKNNKRKIGFRTISTAVILFGLLFIGNQTLFAQESKTYKNIAEGERKEVDKEAEYPGGNEALLTFIAAHTKYPKALKDKNIEGTAFVQFIIEKDGSVGRKTIVRGVKNGALLDEAALAAFENMPNWRPAEKDGKKVATSMVMPIKFALSPTPPTPPTPPAVPEK